MESLVHLGDFLWLLAPATRLNSLVLARSTLHFPTTLWNILITDLETQEMVYKSHATMIPLALATSP